MAGRSEAAPLSASMSLRDAMPQNIETVQWRGRGGWVVWGGRGRGGGLGGIGRVLPRVRLSAARWPLPTTAVTATTATVRLRICSDILWLRIRARLLWRLFPELLRVSGRILLSWIPASRLTSKDPAGKPRRVFAMETVSRTLTILESASRSLLGSLAHSRPKRSIWPICPRPLRVSSQVWSRQVARSSPLLPIARTDFDFLSTSTLLARA
jgi:hypothetical protein